MKLIVGLGNPGHEYEKTRHNIGYMFLDFITDNKEFKLNKRFNAMEYEIEVDNQKVLFIKPLSFMNLSGEVVRKYVNFYKINNEDILVIQDDIDMTLGSYKLQYNHGDGGHNGIKNIISNLNSKEFMRLKIGVSKNTDMDTKDYVLGKFSSSELKMIKNNFTKLSDLINDYVSVNKDILMGKYNNKIQEG